MDTTLLNVCRETGIAKTGANASEFRTCPKCGGVTHKLLGSPRRTTYDLTKDNAVHSETENIRPDDLLHREGQRCSHCAEMLINLSDLQALINSGQDLHDDAVEGTDPGQYAVGSKATLQTALTTAQTLVDADASTQVQVNAAETTLASAVATFEAGLVE